MNKKKIKSIYEIILSVGLPIMFLIGIITHNENLIYTPIVSGYCIFLIKMLH